MQASDYYCRAVYWAVEQGITNGTGETTFSPDDPCTRAQMATFLWRAAGCPEPAVTACRFNDVPKDAYYAKAVLWALQKGITRGTDIDTFDPEAPCTRGQMAAFLYRYSGSPAVSGTIPFFDVAENAYYHSPVLWAVQNKVTTGTTAVTFGPEEDCTRGQMAAFLYRLLGN